MNRINNHRNTIIEILEEAKKELDYANKRMKKIRSKLLFRDTPDYSYIGNYLVNIVSEEARFRLSVLDIVIKIINLFLKNNKLKELKYTVYDYVFTREKNILKAILRYALSKTPKEDLEMEQEFLIKILDLMIFIDEKDSEFVDYVFPNGIYEFTPSEEPQLGLNYWNYSEKYKGIKFTCEEERKINEIITSLWELR